MELHTSADVKTGSYSCASPKYIKALVRTWIVISVLVVVWSFIPAIPGADISIVLNSDPLPQWTLWGLCLVGDVWFSLIVAAGLVAVLSC